MNQQLALDLAQGALTMALMLSAPILVAALVVGTVVSIFQAATQIQEMTLSFVPKALAVSAVAIFMGPWMVSTMLAYTTHLFEMLPQLVR
jgi:flagellar biosynthetic protein FliQ